MFNNFAKFELPAIRGEELWPNAIQSPLIVRASLEYTPNENDPPHADVLTGHFHEIIDNNTPRILNFLTTQRRNYQLGSVDFASTIRTVDALTLHYTNIQGKHEILQLNGQLIPAVYERLQQVSIEREKFREEEFPEIKAIKYRKEEKKEEEEEDLCVLVFYGGNRIAYAPMATLKNTTGKGVATRRKLVRSSWDTDLVKTCQMRFIEKTSVIYTGLKGWLSKVISRGKEYTLTTALLLDEIATQSDEKREWPIMVGNGATLRIPSADVHIDAKGRLSIMRTVPSVGLNRYGKAPLRPWHIDTDGTRYDSGLTTEQTGALFASFTAPWMLVDAGGEEFSAQTLVNVLGAIEDSPYLGNIRVGGNTSASGQEFAYLKNGVKTFDGELTAEGNYPDAYYIYETLVLMPTTRHYTLDKIDYTATQKSPLYAKFYHHPNAGVYYQYYVIYADFKKEGEIGFIPTTRYIDDLYFIVWPPSLNDKHWLLHFSTTETWGGQLVSMVATLTTSYGRLTKQVGTKIPAFRGWLHISNGRHLLQAFTFGADRYMYLDNRRISSLLGVAVKDIQTVLFDIPLAKIEAFK